MKYLTGTATWSGSVRRVRKTCKIIKSQVREFLNNVILYHLDDSILPSCIIWMAASGPLLTLNEPVREVHPSHAFHMKSQDHREAVPSPLGRWATWSSTGWSACPSSYQRVGQPSPAQSSSRSRQPRCSLWPAPPRLWGLWVGRAVAYLDVLLLVAQRPIQVINISEMNAV